MFTLNGAGPTASTTPTEAKTVQSKPDTKSAESQPAKPAATTTTSAPVGISEMKLPTLGENIEKGTVTKILVKVGDAIKKGQGILELETDKAALEVHFYF